MTYQSKDGGQAFPHGGNDCEDAQDGMTLRDWFAGQALSGLLAAGMGHKTDMLHTAPYEIAAAMLEARKK